MNELKDLLLRRPRLTLAVAESLTCGRIQARVGEISGASGFFLGGLTAYTIEEKIRHLRIDGASARRARGVSARVAAEMAMGVCRLFGSDLGVATTGYAEPSRDAGVKDPFAWWAVAHQRRPLGTRRGRAAFASVSTGRVECPGAGRVEAQVLVADAALAELLAYLRALRISG